MATTLMRTVLQPFYRAANEAHPGLLIQRGLALYDQDSEAGREAKTSHLRRICAIPASDFYQHAYARWEAATANPARFRQVRLELLSRLFIGLSGGGMLETGCAISHSYGTPYIPGSSLKGVVRSHVRGSRFAQDHPQVIDELFGVDADPESHCPAGLSGLVTFHDAWWVPGSAPKPHVNRPLVEEVVTTHHLEYYGQEGTVPASDTDSPIPNAQLAARGQFLFVLEGPPAWLDLAEKMLTTALANQGIGAKTRTGYGLFDPVPKVPAQNTQVPLKEQWTGVEVKLNPGNGELTATHQGRVASIRNSDAQGLRDRLPEELRGRLKKQRAMKNCTVSVERLGNAWGLVEIQSVGGIALTTRADGT